MIIDIDIILAKDKVWESTKTKAQYKYVIPNETEKQSLKLGLYWLCSS